MNGLERRKRPGLRGLGRRGEPTISIARMYVSPGHNYFGHHGKPPSENPLYAVSEVRCVAGRGIVGDRFFDHKQGYKGQITFFAMEVYEALCDTLAIMDKHPGVFRRNVITRGVDLNEWIDREFEIQGVRFRGVAECSPCYWMEKAFGPGRRRRWRAAGVSGHES